MPGGVTSHTRHGIEPVCVAMPPWEWALPPHPPMGSGEENIYSVLNTYSVAREKFIHFSGFSPDTSYRTAGHALMNSTALIAVIRDEISSSYPLTLRLVLEWTFCRISNVDITSLRKYKTQKTHQRNQARCSNWHHIEHQVYGTQE